MARILAWLALILGGGLYLLNRLSVTAIGDNLLWAVVGIAGLVGVILTRRAAD